MSSGPGNSSAFSRYVPWDGVQGRPTQFPPSAHTHLISDLRISGTGTSGQVPVWDAASGRFVLGNAPAGPRGIQGPIGPTGPTGPSGPVYSPLATRRRGTSALLVNSSFSTDLEFDTTDFDDLSIASGSAQTQFTVPSGATRMRVTVGAVWDIPPTTGTSTLRVVGSTGVLWAQDQRGGGPTSLSTTVCTGVISVSGVAWIKADIFQDSGVAKDLGLRFISLERLV